MLVRRFRACKLFALLPTDPEVEVALVARLNPDLWSSCARVR